MPHRTPEPAMQPLHPERPGPARIGDVYEKRNTGTKTSVKVPMIRVLDFGTRAGHMVVKPLNFVGKHGFTLINQREMTLEVLDRDWRKVSL